ncbi:HAD-IIIC family phosphatase [Paenibacillus sp. chi10]|uniref:HAD-IIIC family phosphatase n=1 Tax=Paenibacillus suaedae TaxID=3077233 RepID=A0AAJ2JU39_9BACL|nr:MULTISPECIES: HAD-IIIC family phosphatase [unclassified Paenibacillus]MDT8977095.1 HAD-IIIC family phosphatase [Paenibacillus sp. chi10]GAV14220.1 FkbH like protein [Paenibacillus sp. NAIST15-1]
MEAVAAKQNAQRGNRKIKCLVWDLDNTLWEGVLLEDSNVRLKDRAAEVIKELDRRGILQSVASKNDYAAAIGKLKELGLSEYFLFPQINWNSKSSSISVIQESLNIGFDTFAFIDDQPFEREEVAFTYSDVLCLDANQLDTLLELPELMPDFVTEESQNRRLMYMSDYKRNTAEKEFEGPQEEFLATLGMVMRISPARSEDLQRAEELTLRTNQLNTTGYTYSFNELEALSRSNRHKLLVASLEDIYGTYGTIGLSLVELDEEVWRLKLLLMSCRVMSRGVGSIMLQHLLQSAKQAGARFQAEFISNDRNRMMYITFKFAGFQEVASFGDGGVILENNFSQLGKFPDYVTVQVVE